MKQRRGFSLLEIVITVAIVALLAAVAYPFFTNSIEKGKLNDVTKRMLAHFTKARNLAASGQTDSSWGGGDRTITALVRIESATGYTVYIDRDDVWDGDEVAVQVVDFTISDPGSDIRITAPAPLTVIRFRSNGTLTGGGQVDITLTDNNRTRNLRVTVGGLTKISS